MTSSNKVLFGNSISFDTVVDCQKVNRLRLLKARICTLILIIGIGVAAYFNKDILDYAKDHQWQCITATSIGGTAFLSSLAALLYFTLRKSALEEKSNQYNLEDNDNFPKPVLDDGW